MKKTEATRFITEVFDAWFPALVRYAYRATGDFALAEDVVQSAFLSLYANLAEDRPVDNPKGWLLCVVRREVIRHWERDWKALPLDERFEVEDPAPRSDQEAPEPLRWDEVLPHFTVLTKREEEVLLLRLQSMKYREIAASLGIQTSSVNVLLARAIRKLRQVLSKYQAGNFPAGKGLARAPRRLQ